MQPGLNLLDRLRTLPPDEIRAAAAKVRRMVLFEFLRASFRTVVPGDRFVANWHLRAITYALERVASGDTRRLVITLPPRGLKSITASVAFPAWILGRDPTTRIVCASYSRDLAGKLSRDCRTVMRSEWYRRVFPRTVIDARKDTEFDFATTRHGGRYATSVDGTLTGRGGNLIVIDDPLKAQDAHSESARRKVADWYDKTVLSRLDNKTEDAIVIVTQRLHPDDLVGHVLNQGEWEHLCVPAIAPADAGYQIGSKLWHRRLEGGLLIPEREPQTVLDELRATLGTAAFSAQYQQDPVPAEGHLVKWQWFRNYVRPPEERSGDRIVQSWDTALSVEGTSDYSVCTTWYLRGELHWLLDIYRARLLFPDLTRAVVEQKERWGADDILIEDKGSGASLIQSLDAARIFAIPIRPESDKRSRLAAETPTIEAGKVFLPHEAPWLDDFRLEILQFPHGGHDDQVDSMSQYLRWVREREDGRIGFVPVRGNR